MHRIIIVFLFSFFAIVGCESESISRNSNPGVDDDNPGNDTGEGSGSENLDDTDTNSFSNDTSTEEEQCGELNFPIELLPPRMMLLIDSSASMMDHMIEDDSSSPVKWPIAQTALTQMVANWGGNIHFGFDIFPDSGNCNVNGPVKQDVQLDNGLSVQSFVAGHTPGGSSTPLYCGMANFLDPTYSPMFTSPSANSYLVVVSDGSDLCGEGCCVPNPFQPASLENCSASKNEFANLTQDLFTQNIMTYVIGFGEGVSEDQLEAIAQNGGTGETSFFDAADQQTLEDALTVIGQSVVSCSYAIELPSAQSDPGKVNFYFDEEVVYYDEDCALGVGWTWTDDEHKSIRFCEDACNQLKAGSVENIKATFGCKSITPV